MCDEGVKLLLWNLDCLERKLHFHLLAAAATRLELLLHKILLFYFFSIHCSCLTS